MDIREKRHRLPKEFYIGEISIAFTLCLKGDVAAAPKAFGVSLREHSIVTAFIDILTSVTAKENCIVPVYCFMPDHQHLIITGTRTDSDIFKALVSYKQKTGFWMSKKKPGMKWQKDFYDYVIKRPEDIATQIRYILDNPVRKGLVSSWQEYPFKGSIGCKMEDILNGII
jgi:REP element-mobilizing transposase RayT